jgi:hypothetical protein
VGAEASCCVCLSCSCLSPRSVARLPRRVGLAVPCCLSPRLRQRSQQQQQPAEKRTGSSQREADDRRRQSGFCCAGGYGVPFPSARIGALRLSALSAAAAAAVGKRMQGRRGRVRCGWVAACGMGIGGRRALCWLASNGADAHPAPRAHGCCGRVATKACSRAHELRSISVLEFQLLLSALPSCCCPSHAFRPPPSHHSCHSPLASSCRRRRLVPI